MLRTLSGRNESTYHVVNANGALLGKWLQYGGLKVSKSAILKQRGVQRYNSTMGRGRSNEFGKKEGSPFINHRFLLLLRTYIANSREHCMICRRNWQESLLNSVLYGMLHSMSYAREGPSQRSLDDSLRHVARACRRQAMAAQQRARLPIHDATYNNVAHF